MSERTEISRWLDGLAAAAGPGPIARGDIDAQVAELVVRSRRHRRQRYLAMAATGIALAASIALLWVWRPGLLGHESRRSELLYQAPSWVEPDSPIHSTRPAPTTRPVSRSGEGTAAGGVELASAPPVDSVVPAAEEPPPLEAASASSAVPPGRARRTTRERAPAPVTAAQLLDRARQARGRRDAGAAREALLEVRHRFPGRSEAEEATFLLGRVELELARRPEHAIDWFEEYVDRYPHGRFAAQARGRIVHHRASHGTPRQVTHAASEYLRYHPSGPYVGLARRLLEGATDPDDAAPAGSETGG